MIKNWDKIGDRIVLVGDLNGKNIIWESKRENKRGEKILEWMIEKNLDLCNGPLDTPSFKTTRAEGWTDLTIFKNNWKIKEEESLSDHQYITYEIEIGIKRKERTKIDRENIDYDKIYKEIKNRMDKEENAEKLQKSMERIWSNNIKYKKEGEEGEWWKEELEIMRRKVNKTRREAEKEKESEEMRKEKMEKYKTERRAYKNKIKEEKKKYLRDLLNEDEKNSWDIGYKILKNERKGRKEMMKTI